MSHTRILLLASAAALGLASFGITASSVAAVPALDSALISTSKGSAFILALNPQPLPPGRAAQKGNGKGRA